MGTNGLLARAEQHIFSTGVDDSGTALGQANLKYGLAKIHHVQSELGLQPDATFISAPDFTVTRNTARWLSGFSYGGSLSWGDGTQDLIFLDLKPNACGILVGGLWDLPSAETIVKRIHDIHSSPVEINGVMIQWDFGKSNHFIDLLRVHPVDGYDLPPYVFMMHVAGGELRGENEIGEGLYWDLSSVLRSRMVVFQTPFGPLRVLLGEDAQSYYRYYRQVEAFALERRLKAAELIFGEFELIHNGTHQGLRHMNEILLGCYSFTDGQEIFPIGLRPDATAYLIRGLGNLGEDAISRLGFEQRAHNLGMNGRLSQANLLPHGGGYTFPHIAGVSSVVEMDDERYFVVSMRSSGANQIVHEVRNLPFEYRGDAVVRRTLELGMGELVAELEPKLVLKV